MQPWYAREAEVAPEFDQQLGEVDRGSLDAAPDVVFGLGPDLTIGYVNTSWWRFARDNDARWEERAWGLGDHVLEAIPEVLRDYYASAFAGVQRMRQPWEHDYECSSATTFRMFRLRAMPLPRGAGLLVAHAVRVERPHDRVAEGVVGDLYVNEHGLVAQCAHCRRVRRAPRAPPGGGVPDYVAAPVPTISHTICEVCVGYYFGPYASARSRRSAATQSR
jgi:hypothetical protein